MLTRYQKNILQPVGNTELLYDRTQKTEYRNYIKDLLTKINRSYTRETKVRLAERLFCSLIVNKWFFIGYTQFQKVVIKKIRQLTDVEISWDEARVFRIHLEKIMADVNKE